MNKTVRLSLRMRESTNEMLERLVLDDIKEAERINRVPMNRSEMVEMCITEYYAARHDGKLHNAYLDMATASLTPLLQQAVNTLHKAISELGENAGTQIERNSLTIQQQLKLLILAPHFSDDENMARFYLGQKAAYEKPVEEITEKLMEERGIK